MSNTTRRSLIELIRRVTSAHHRQTAWGANPPWMTSDMMAAEDEILRDAPELASAAAELVAKLESGDASDGYHTHNELYEYRTLYHAHAARAWVLDGVEVTKSWRHADGELCFGGGWFIVTAQLPTGQVSNHYPERDWELFDVPVAERPAPWDGHTPQEAAERLRSALARH